MIIMSVSVVGVRLITNLQGTRARGTTRELRPAGEKPGTHGVTRIQRTLVVFVVVVVCLFVCFNRSSSICRCTIFQVLALY